MEESSIKRSKCRTSALLGLQFLLRPARSKRRQQVAALVFIHGLSPVIIGGFRELSSLVLGQPCTFEAGRMSGRLYHSYARGYLGDPRQVKISAVHTCGS